MSKRQREKTADNMSDKEMVAFVKLRLSLITTPDKNPEAGILLMPDFRKLFILAGAP